LSEITVNWEKAIRDLQAIGTTWASDLEKLKSDLESVVYNLTHLEVKLKIEGEDEPIRKTELNLITGDITVTFPAGTDIKGIDIEKINIATIKMAREELKERIGKLLELIEILINAISPVGTLKSVLDVIKASIPERK